MLAKKYRLSGKEINLIHKRGKKFNAGELGIKYFTNNLGYPRFAVNIPVKTYKKATERNRYRRIIYEEVSKLKLPGNDFIISLYRPIDEKAIRGKIQEVFRRINH